MNKNFKKTILIFITIIFTASVYQGQLSNNKKSLFDGFQNPPNEAKPSVYYMLLNGYMNTDYVGKEMEQLHEKGIGGVCVFDMGMHGNEKFFAPSGPKFMSEKWISNFSHIVKKAGELDMNVQLAVCSSWDMGADWVEPDEAVLALFKTHINVTGPVKLNKKIEFPVFPKTALLDSLGTPLFYKEVATLAIPVIERQIAHEFIFRLPTDKIHRVDNVILYNIDDEKKLYTKNFSVSVSSTDDKDKSFKQILKDSLEANAKAQRFSFKKVDARFIRLRIYDGHNKLSDQVQLAEFEVFEDGNNIVYQPRFGRHDGGALVKYNSALGSYDKWTARNIADGEFSGAAGCWSSDGLPPLFIKNKNSIVDITENIDENGVLTWDVPKGEWEIIRYMTTNTGEMLKLPNPASDGLATDHFSKKATWNFIKHLTSSLEKQLGPLENTSLKQFYLPSYEVRGAVWTTDLLEQFEKRRSYNMTKYLPALSGHKIESDDVTNRFLFDFHKTMGDVLIDTYYITAGEAAAESGLEIEAESGGPGPPVHLVPVDALKALNAVGQMRGEFWPWQEERKPIWVVKETAVAAHIYGRKFVHMEAFTGFRHWKEGPINLKPSADRAFCEGMNHVVWHTSSHNPPEAGSPGWVYNAGTHFDPKLIWWNKSKPWIDYLTRTSFLLQQGLFVGDVVYYYGDKGSNFVPPKHIDPSLGFGFDYDVTNLDVLVNRMDVKDNKIVLPDGMSYEILVLQDDDYINIDALKKIEQLVEKGATIIGKKPVQSNGLANYPNDDNNVKILADKLWGSINGTTITENKYGKGKVVWGKTLKEVLSERGVSQDFQFVSEDEKCDLDFIHRRTESDDIYFIRNKRNEANKFIATFRVKEKTPELWIPDTGERIQQLVYNKTDDGISFEINLDKYGSVFVIFSPNKSENFISKISGNNTVNRIENKKVYVTSFENGNYEIITSDSEAIKFAVNNIPNETLIEGEWKISFMKNWGAPKSITINELRPLTKFTEEGVKYYSGISTYEIEFNISNESIGENKKIFIDFGKLWLLGEVFVNEKSLGYVWKEPYQIEITSAAKSGLNKLKIEIANTWANRLIGDALNLDKKQYTKTNIIGYETYKNIPWAKEKLISSGLFGPVKLIYATQNTISISE